MNWNDAKEKLPAVGEKVVLRHVIESEVIWDGRNFYNEKIHAWLDPKMLTEKNNVYWRRRMSKWRKRPIVIEAEQFIPGENPFPAGMIMWPYNGVQPRDGSFGFIETLEGRMHVMARDWIITGINGEKYPCKPDIFEKTYEAVVE